MEQLPRIRVYRTAGGRLVVYRTWPSVFGLPPTFTVYGDLRGLESDPQSLATTWITEHDPLGERSDLAPALLRSLKKVLARQIALSIDALEQSQLGPANCQPVRLDRDTNRIAPALVGTGDLDVLLESMHLLGSTASDPKHLSQIENTFRELKPISRLGNAPEDLKEFQVAMCGYLNNDSRERAPSQRLFVNPKRGFWGVSAIGDRRAVEVLRRLGIVRVSASPTSGAPAQTPDGVMLASSCKYQISSHIQTGENGRQIPMAKCGALRKAGPERPAESDRRWQLDEIRTGIKEFERPASDPLG